MNFFKLILILVMVFSTISSVASENKISDLESQANCATLLLYGTAEKQLSNTYQQAAEVIVPLALQTLKTKLLVFSENGYLKKDAKLLRKYLLEVRLYYEVLGYGFPAETIKNDPWYEGWLAIRKGYRFLGKFKSAKPADAELYQEKMNKLKKWTEQFIKDVDAIVLKLGKPSKDNSKYVRIFPVEGMHWDSDLLPDDVTSNTKSVVIGLTMNLLNKAKNEIKDVYATTDFEDEFNSEAFHDFRKQLRVVIKLVDAFPTLYVKTESYNELVQVVWYLGQHNDLVEPLVKRSAYIRSGLDYDNLFFDKYKKSKKSVKKSWENYKGLFSEAVVNRLIKDFIEEIDPYQ